MQTTKSRFAALLCFASLMLGGVVMGARTAR